VDADPINVPAGGRTTAELTITANANTPLGTSEVDDLGVTTSGGNPPKVVIKATIDAPKPLAGLRNSVGVVDDAHAAGAAFDSTGHSYSRQALAAVGVTGGGTVSIGGFDYTWPDVAAGGNDNYLTDGTRIALG